MLYLARTVRSGYSPDKKILADVLRFEPSAELLETGEWIGHVYGGSVVGGHATETAAWLSAVKAMTAQGWTDDLEAAKRDANAQAQARAKPHMPAVLLTLRGRPSAGKEARIEMRVRPENKVKAQRLASASNKSVNAWFDALIESLPDA